MYDLYEYISECAIATAFSNVIYCSSCSAALTVRPTSVERAMLRKRSFPCLRFPHILRVHIFHVTLPYNSSLLLSKLVPQRLVRLKHMLQRSRAIPYLEGLYLSVSKRDCL
jgi:hypothetical protein